MSLVKSTYPTSGIYCVALCTRDLGKKLFGHGNGHVDFVESGIDGALMDG